MILDTNGLSGFADGHSRVKELVMEAGEIEIPVVVLGEYRFGIAQSRRKGEYHRWLQELLSNSTVLNITEETTIWYAGIRLALKGAGTPIPSNDIWIAALCRQHNLPLLSRDRHFDNVAGLRRLDW